MPPNIDTKTYRKKFKKKKSNNNIGMIVDVIEDYSLIVISAKKKIAVTLF